MTDEPFSILIVDDEPNIRSGLAKGLAKEAGVIETAGSSDEAEEAFASQDFQLVIADVRLPGKLDGLQFVEKVLQSNHEVAAIVITAHGTVETAVHAMRIGAFDFITKPLDLDLVRQQVRKAREHNRLQNENRVLRGQLAEAGEVSGIVGNCAAMQQVLQQVRQVAGTDATVMIHGESGTGKELIARAVHDLSMRSTKPFIAVNLGALPDTLLESELFGHEKGSFTGAARQKPGCFEQANHGSLFLDEITEIPAKCQVDLLRVLETRQFTRIGGEDVLSADVRIISATNRAAVAEVEDGTFREDLFYRLNVVPIYLPPLRDRRDDIPLLADHFLGHFCRRHHRDPKTLTSAAMEKLLNHPWPGNIRQLRNVIERLVVTITSDTIDAKDIAQEPSGSPRSPSSNAMPSLGAKTLAEAVEIAEKSVISEALAACEFHREHTAKRLGISVRSLHYKMNRYSLH